MGMHKERIFGGHVGEYMEYLEEEDNQKYQEQFKIYIENDVEADGLEELYEEVHEKIREDPSAAEKKAFEPDRVTSVRLSLPWSSVRSVLLPRRPLRRLSLRLTVMMSRLMVIS